MMLLGLYLLPEAFEEPNLPPAESQQLFRPGQKAQQVSTRLIPYLLNTSKMDGGTDHLGRRLPTLSQLLHRRIRTVCPGE